MKLKGRISITRVHGDNLTHPVSIRFIDDSSGAYFAEAHMTLENFSLALLGLSHVDCELEAYPDAPLGKILEHKTVLFPQPGYAAEPERKQIAAKLFKPYEVDGWRGRVSDLFNHHKWTKHNQVSVTFSRYIDPPEGFEPVR